MGMLTRGSTSPHVGQYLAAAESFSGAVGRSDLNVAVPSCPGWSAYDLVVHVGNVHAWAATIVETGQRAVEQNDEPRSARPKVVSQWYAAKAEDLYQVLRQVPPDRHCWNFVEGTGVAAFWARRQLHETTMHHVDLDLACGRTPQLASEVAADGVSEVLGVLVHRMYARGHTARLEEPLVLEATDTGDTWVVVPQAGPPRLEQRASRAEGVRDRVQAPADVLYRMLWRRPVDRASVRMSGEESRINAFLESRLAP
jgi:uncharacterized protein (TIGR03083 family)